MRAIELPARKPGECAGGAGRERSSPAKVTMISTPATEEDRLAQRQPRIIVVGTGRDGTLSTYQMIQDLFDRADGRRAMHEYAARELYNAFSNYRETGDERFIGEIRRLIGECPYDCVVGNGYAAILPYFREQWGLDTKLVHLRRRDRDACIASLVKNAQMFPFAHLHYASAEGAGVKRPAAFHFGEMTRDEWQAMPAAAKFGWYYDKTHALINQYKALFAESIDVFTEDLSDELVRRALARLVNGSDCIVPAPARVHAYAFDITSVGKEYRDKAMWVWGQMDWERVVKDDLHGIEYLLTKFFQWKERQVKGDPLPGAQESRVEISAALARARKSLAAALKQVERLEKLDGETLAGK